MAFCKTCGTTNEDMFYASIKTYCREHWKTKVRANRVANIEHYRSFDKMRASMPHRVAAREAYRKSEAGRLSHKAANQQWMKKNPKRKAAAGIVGKAIRSGKLKKLPCFICGSPDVEAHHPSYDHPLVVTWLCVTHHKEVHWHMKEAA